MRSPAVFLVITAVLSYGGRLVAADYCAAHCNGYGDAMKAAKDRRELDERVTESSTMSNTFDNFVDRFGCFFVSKCMEEPCYGDDLEISQWDAAQDLLQLCQIYNTTHPEEHVYGDGVMAGPSQTRVAQASAAQVVQKLMPSYTMRMVDL